MITLLVCFLAAGEGVPVPPEELLGQARKRLAEENFVQAQELAARAADGAPNLADAWLVLGLAEFRGGHPDPARAAFARAAELAPDSAVIRFNLGSASFESGHYDEAEQAYLEAASRDERVEALALLRAGQAALSAKRLDAAEVHFRAALQAARRHDATPLAEEAQSRLDEVALRLKGVELEPVRELVQAGKSALLAKQWDEAIARYSDARAAALAVGLPPADRAEIEYALGQAHLRRGDRMGALAAFEQATRLAPGEGAFFFMLGVVHAEVSTDAEEVAARGALEHALALGLGGSDAVRARRILDLLGNAADRPSARWALDARAGAGFDSNVPQSGVLVIEPTTQAAQSPAAPELAAEADLYLRPLGEARQGLAIDYRFTQLAYLSGPLDTYSLQEHDLGFAGTLSPRRWLTLEADFDSFLLFSGIETFDAFQVGVGGGPRLTLRETEHWESRLKYEHTFKRALELGFESLSGGRDDVSLVELWRGAASRLWLGYLFRREAVGQETIAVDQISFPLGPPPTSTGALYMIPYSYYGNEVSAGGTAWLPLRVRGSSTLRYEHRGYLNASYILEPTLGVRGNSHQRVDNRWSFDLTLLRPISARLELELAYSLVWNFSNIDNTKVATRFDYDDKNYTKHVVEIGVWYRY